MRFDYTGAVQTFKCLANKKYVFDLLGAKGGGGGGGTGGHVQAVYQNTADITLNLYVGGRPTDSADQATNYIGGWNGGGAGGKAVSGAVQPGYYSSTVWNGNGGGGATDFRSGGTGYGNRIFVAGGGGGSDSYGGKGGQYPYNENGDTSPGGYDSEFGTMYLGGKRGTMTAGGAGGAAPVLYGDYNKGEYPGEEGNYYYAPGDGGGGGYYGGGGGSTGTIRTPWGSSCTGTGGGTGGHGVGGTGGTKSGTVYGVGYNRGGGGGGGSSYIATNAQISHGSYDHCANGGMGYILVSEVISAPIITGIRKDGNFVYVKVSKEEREDNVNIEERFYYTWSLDQDQYKKMKSPLASVVIKNNEEVELQYTIASNTSTGNHKLYFYITSADDLYEESFIDFAWNDTAPSIEFNESVLESVLLQGTEIENAFTGTGMFTGETNLIYEKIVIINGNEFGKPQLGSDKSIFLPYIYNGVYDDLYTLKLKVRVGQMAFGQTGTGREIWSDWFESKEYTVYAPIIPINKVQFTSNIGEVAVERHTRISVSWASDARFLEKSSDYDYVLSMYRGDELLYEENYGQETSASIVISYPQGDNYRFGIALLKNKLFPSDINFSESFSVADIATGSKIDLSEDMILTSELDEEFDRIEKIEVYINNDIDCTIGKNKNINLNIPIWKLRGGNNFIDVRIYLNETIYVKHTFKVYMHVLMNDVSNINTHVFNVSASINDEEHYMNLPTDGAYAADLGASEQEFEGRITEPIVQEINQKITIKRTNSDFNELKIIEILGGLD